jgi:HK97 family phage major capsid protein
MNRFPVLSLAALALVGALMLFAAPGDALATAIVLANTAAAVTPEALKALEDTLTKKAGEVVETVQKALKDEVEKFNGLTTKTNESITEASKAAKAAVDAVSEMKQRLTELEQKLARKPGQGGEGEQKSPGYIFAHSEELKAALERKSPDVGAVNVGEVKTAMLNATGQNQPLVPDQRVPGIITPPNRVLTIRDLMPQLRTDSNLIQFASESVYTNNAGPQFSSPNDRENVVKNESGITFTLANAAVATIAHWIPASRQLLADAKGLSDYINSRLMYGLKLEEEEQLLNGDGTGGNLNGIYTQGTAYNRGQSNDTVLDCLLKAVLQVAIAEYAATGYVLNPIDWTAIQLMKDTQNRYLFSNPHDVTAARIWGLPVVSTNSMTAGTFLTGAFALGAAVWDREDATIRVAEEHDDFFVRNMVAILCEERVALTVYRTQAFVKGSLPAVGT